MAITDTNLDTTVWDEIRSKIVALAPYVTNSTTSATTTASIEATYNDKTFVKAKPYVVIQPIEDSEGDYKFGSSNGKKVINVVVDCYYKNSLGADQLAQQIRASLSDNDISGIDLSGITTNASMDEANDAKFRLKSRTFTYIRE